MTEFTNKFTSLRRPTFPACLVSRTIFKDTMLPALVLTLVSLSSLVSGDIEVSIDEEVSPGTEVTRLPSHPSAYGGLPDDQITLMTYDILGQNTPPATFFRIDPRTGVVTVASRMDRESICDPGDRCSVKINIAIQASEQAQVSFSTVVTLDVVINDVNDNPPRFSAREVTLDFPENTKVGTEQKISGAVDLDSKPQFTVQHYNITPALDTFSLRATKNLDGRSTVNLRLEKELDRERMEEYVFNIMAYDGGSVPQSDYLKVTVRVLDDNDNAPKFSQSKYEMTVNENEVLGASVGKVSATDIDAGNFGRITYSFSPSSETAIKGVFTINSSTGLITLTGGLRSIKKSSPLQMFVDAKDGGDPPLSTQAVVSVLVINSGNTAPSIKVNTVAAADVSTLSIPESAGLDHFVAFVDIEDNDDGDNGKVTCMIVQGADFKLNPVPNKGYTLLLNAEVDREKKDSYQITISCRDGGTPPLERRVNLTVNVTDINDNTPKFSDNLYTATVDENREPGQFVAQVAAHDDDVGVNAEITYSLQKEANEYFRINSKTGIISTSGILDREKNSVLRFKVFAADRGDKPRTGVAEISVSIKDINDNNPQFNKSKFIFSISEQAPNYTIVGTLEAHDLDIGANGQFDFYFGGSTTGEMPLPFAVLKNGSIQVTGFLDRETKAQYSFTALVRDRGEIPRSSAVPVEIKILDENDNDPVILFPTSKNHTIAISNYPENGMVLGRIIAYDMDEGGSTDLKFYIYDGNEDGAFSMGLNTGELILHHVERLQTPHEYFLSVKVEDSTKKPRNATTQLRVDVNFDNATLLYVKGESSQEQYIIIVGVIGGATIVLSIIIVSAIIIILRSEKNRRHVHGDPSAKAKFFSGTKVRAVPVQKHVDNSLDTGKSQSSSSLGSDSHGLGQGKPNNKHEDVQKKVSFSLQDVAHDQLPGRHLRLNIPPSADGSMQWKKLNKPDDINSDTSGESGTCDSGRGTSDEDIKFDHLLNRGPSRLGEPLLSVKNRSFDQFVHPNAANVRSVSSLQSHSGQRLRAAPPPTRPGQTSISESRTEHQDAENLRNGYHGQLQLPLTSFTSGVPSSTRNPSRHRVYNSYKDISNVPPNLLRPSSAMGYSHQDPSVSMDDDASTTTSGSYIITPDEVRLEGFMDKDVVV